MPLLAWVTPWLHYWNSGVALAWGASLRMPPKKHCLANPGARGVARPLLPSTPTTADKCSAADEGSPVGVMDGDDGGYPPCSEDPQDRAFGEEIGVDPRQAAPTMHWAQTAFQNAREPRSKHGELSNCRDGVPLPL